MGKGKNFLSDIGELLSDLSLFVNKFNPNPAIAIAAIELFKGYVVNKYIFKVEVHDVKITYKEVRELYDSLWEFFKELDLYEHPDLIITALEMIKYYNMKEIERLLSEAYPRK